MESTALVSKSKQQPSELDRERLIKAWVLRFALNAARQIDAPTSAATVALWQEAFVDLEITVLESAFQRTLATCKFFPSVAEIRAHVDRADTAGLKLEAEEAWHYVLDYASRWYLPDIGLDRRAPKLPEKIMRALRATRGLRALQSCGEEALVWEKKSFVGAFERADELERAGELVTREEVRKILADWNAADLAKRGALPECTRREPASVEDSENIGLVGLREILAQHLPDSIPQTRSASRGSMRVAPRLSRRGPGTAARRVDHETSVHGQRRGALREVRRFDDGATHAAAPRNNGLSTEIPVASKPGPGPRPRVSGTAERPDPPAVTKYPASDGHQAIDSRAGTTGAKTSTKEVLFGQDFSRTTCR